MALSIKDPGWIWYKTGLVRFQREHFNPSSPMALIVPMCGIEGDICYSQNGVAQVYLDNYGITLKLARA